MMSFMAVMATTLFWGGDGDDVIDGGPGDDHITTGNNDDTIVASLGTDTIDGGSENDTYLVGGGAYRFIGATAGDRTGHSVSSAGDVDGDGLADIIIGAPEADGEPVGTGLQEGESYLIAAADLAAADAADGTTDGEINLGNIAGLTSSDPDSYSYQFFSTEPPFGQMGWSVSSAGDVDGDGRADLLIGAPSVGETYLISGQHLATLDEEGVDGIDGRIDVGEVAGEDRRRRDNHSLRVHRRHCRGSNGPFCVLCRGCGWGRVRGSSHRGAQRGWGR